jgi:hypothetical protein
MEKFPDKITYGDKYEPGMKITEQDKADEYFEACVEHTMRICNVSREEAVNVEKQNFGYYAGYYGRDTQERVNRLFKTTHPIFGDKQPTIDEALEAGKQMAAES